MPGLRPARHVMPGPSLCVMPGSDRASVIVVWKSLHIRYGSSHKPPRKNSVKGLPGYNLSFGRHGVYHVTGDDVDGYQTDSHYLPAKY